MSLINDALKKAQKLRNEDPAAELPPVPGENTGGRVSKRGRPRNARTLALVAGGALALIVISVGVTAYLVNRRTPPVVVASAVPKTTPPASGSTSVPTIVPPTMTPPATSTPATPTTSELSPASGTSAPLQPPPITPAKKGAAPAPKTAGFGAGEPSKATNSPRSSTPAPAPRESVPPAAAASPPEPVRAGDAKPDERVAAFVEAVRVTGIRSSGTESRVLMNERVYRVNDVVERTLGIRLVKVAADSLTFSDANGVTYVKYF